MTRAEEKLKELSRFGAGAIDELLFGIPEFAIKNLGGRKAAEEWIAEAPNAYKAGETAGTIGSAFLPFGLLGKLPKAASITSKLLPTAKIAPAAIEAAKSGSVLGRLARFGARGAAAGGLESGLRNITSESDDSIVDAITSGAKWGAGGGILGGALAENMPRIAKLLKKNTEKAVLGTVDPRTRDLMQTVARQSLAVS